MSTFVRTANGTVRYTDDLGNPYGLSPSNNIIPAANDPNVIYISDETSPSSFKDSLRVDWRSITVPSGLTSRNELINQLVDDFFFRLGGSGSGRIVFVFDSSVERDAFFTNNLPELFPGLNIITAGDVEIWTGENRPSSYVSTNWHETGIALNAAEIKTIYESNLNTNAFTDVFLEILGKLSIEANGDIRSSVTFIFPPGSIQIGDTVMSSGGRVVTVRSGTTGNRGSIVIQRYDANGFMHPTFPDPEMSAQAFDIQVANQDVSSGITATNVRQVVQADVQFQKVQFKPNGALPTSFTFEVRLSPAGDTIYQELVLTADLTDLGGGTFELDLINNPAQFDAGSSVYIRIAGLDLFGGNGFTGSDTIRFGDASKSNFFPWLRSVSVPIRRLRFASEDFVLAQRGGFNSQRGFNVFNDGFTIDNTNIVTYEDRNNIYAAKIDKIVDVFLPSDADITAANVSYPVAFEFTHLGGTAVIPGNNLLRIYIADGDIRLSADSPAALRINQVAVITKAAAGADWVASVSLLDPMSTLLPSGVFDLQVNREVDIPTIDTDLAGLTIDAGHAFIVRTGGDRFGADIEVRDVIVALVGTPSLAANSDDWLVLSSKIGRSLTTDEVLFFNQVVRDGIRFDLSSNVFVNPANVIIQSHEATGVPVRSNFVLTPNTQNEETVILGNVPVQFSSLTGGRLTLQYNIITFNTGGFLPEFRSLKFDYGNGIVFNFDVRNQPTDGLVTLSIEIPNVDYSTALNNNPIVSLVYIERGFQWLGTIMVSSMINTLKGTLHDSIIALINSETLTLQQDLNNDVTRIDNSLVAVNKSLQDIAGRLDDEILNLPDDVVGILKNDITLTQEDNVTKAPSDYNRQLGGMMTIGAIEEENTPVQSAGLTTTANINQSGVTRRGMKLFYPITDITDGADLIRSNTGGVMRSLVTRVGNNLVAKQRIPAHGGGLRNVIHYPAPPNNFGAPGRWFLLNLKTATFQPVAAEISLTNEIPIVVTTVTIYTRILVNGNRVDSETHTLQVGGVDSSITFVENSGGELVSVTIRYRSTFNDIEVQAVPQNVTGLAIADLEFRAEWNEVITEAAFPETTADHIIAPYNQNGLIPIAIKPNIARVGDNAATMVVVTENAEIDTGYGFTLLFGSGDGGAIEILSEDTPVFDLNFDTNQLILTNLTARIMNPFFGLFTENHTHESVVHLDTQLSTQDKDGNVMTIGTDVILNDVDDNSQYRLTIDKGELVITLIV